MNKLTCCRFDHSVTVRDLVQHLRSHRDFHGFKEKELRHHVIEYMSKKGAYRLGKAESQSPFKVMLYNSSDPPKAVNNKGNVDPKGQHYHVYMGWKIVEHAPENTAGSSANHSTLGQSDKRGNPPHANSEMQYPTHEDMTDTILPTTQHQIDAARAGTSVEDQATLQTKYGNLRLKC